jgi:lipopolysaccharide transport system ATP-binding protein
MHPAIRVENVTKRFRLGARGEPNLTERLLSAFRREPAGAATEFWALQGVSFEVARGEAVGVIGRNGAGKSTLLKVLSRIVEPTAGRVALRGRVGSLLEVGTGFHPELTGRENVFLNGSVLGMSRREIARKFDAIVAFSEVEAFLDTPVKRYSSGMYVRLAFAVAAHLEPEILIVDEVLAVGDAAFQRRCLEAMRGVAASGRTVLVVSHQLDVINRLCRRAVWLDRGRVAATGAAAEVVAAYLAGAGTVAAPGVPIDLSGAARSGSGAARFARVCVSGAGGGPVLSGGPMRVELLIRAAERMAADAVAVTLYDPSGFKLVNADTVGLGRAVELAAGDNVVRFDVRNVYLNPGRYRLGLWLARHPFGVLDAVEAAGEVELFSDPGQTFAPRPVADGVVRCEFEVTAAARAGA